MSLIKAKTDYKTIEFATIEEFNNKFAKPQNLPLMKEYKNSTYIDWSNNKWEIVIDNNESDKI